MSEQPPQRDYEGPIEDIRPGDILSWRRYEEYREFMLKKHGIKNIKIWGQDEEYKDSGQRPFRLAEKPLPIDTPAINPFE